MNTSSTTHFDRQYQTHLKHLKLKGLQPKTIDTYARAIRRLRRTTRRNSLHHGLKTRAESTAGSPTALGSAP